MPAHAQGCLFCLQSDGGFTSREHIFSESLGNDTYVLARGVVCDRCNNGPLAVADGALAGFPPIALLRAERGIPNKAGQASVVKFGATTLWFSEGQTLNIATNSEKVTRGMGPGGGKMDLKGHRLTFAKARTITQAAWKSALELIYWDHGPKEAFDARYDSVRQAVLSGDAEGWAVLPKDATPTDDIRLTYEPRSIGGRDAIPIRLSIFGVTLYTDLLRRDIPKSAIQPPWESNIWTF